MSIIWRLKNGVNNFKKKQIWMDKEFDNVLTDVFQIIKPDVSNTV